MAYAETGSAEIATPKSPVPILKFMVILALFGDRAHGYSQWYHPNSEKGWQKSFFISSKWFTN